jgi:glycosyltransferase involved in cell wall biosynthesis
LDTIARGTPPRVSVIIPSYNTASLIAKCLDSVFAQTFRAFEVIVVNDGSPDTAQLEPALLPYIGKIVYIKQENKGAAGARNTAIARAQGEFLAFLDSDDSWLEDHLASQMEMFRADDALDLAYADALLLPPSAHQKTFMQRCPSEGEANFQSLVVERCQIPISTVVVCKAAIVKAGLFDEGLSRCDDYDMWLRASFFGAKIAYRRNPHAQLFLGRPDSLGSSRLKMVEAYSKILEKIALTLPLSNAQKELVNNRLEQTRARVLIELGKQELHERQPEKARRFFAEANQHFRTVKLSMVVRSLQLAPLPACRLLSAWSRFRGALTV